MIYLIGQLGVWLVLTALFAALAGWAYAAERAAPQQRAEERERQGLLRDISRFALGENDADTAGAERETDAMRRLIEVRDGRIVELESLLSAARSRADEAAGRVAEMQRAIPAPPADNDELDRLRALVAQHEQERAREVEVAVEPVAAVDDGENLQTWRMRYLEQRVKYLENKPTPPALEPVVEPPAMEWRAREAEARAAHLENELRALSTPAAEEAPPFAANAEIDMMLRWRMLYLERRVAHLQGASIELEPAPITESVAAPEPDPGADRWKWRARYLEARVRHLEQKPPQAASRPQQVVAPPVAEPPRVREKPSVLPAARNGAPDDFTLIEDVSVLQQTTLYSLGVFHFDQIADWTPANIAWVDNYLRLRGRIDDEEWVEQAGELAREGVGASRRIRQSETA